nr:ATP-binding cassette domain-containing protein [Fimbriiglobus sp.]
MTSDVLPRSLAQSSRVPVAVSCRAIEKGFGQGETRVRVLRGADFEARAGEMTFLVGPSGCGKTTLISIFGGLLTPDAGTVEVFGTDLRRLSGGRLADFRVSTIGFIFQQFNLLPTLTAAENAAVTLIAQGVPTRRAVTVATELLGRLGLGAHIRKSP